MVSKLIPGKSARPGRALDHRSETEEEREMNKSNRNVWLIVAIIVVPLCCCLLAVVAAAAFFWARAPVISFDSGSRVTERTEQVLDVGEAASLQIQNFAGDVMVRNGQSGRISVTATKRAPNTGRLNNIDVNVSQAGNQVTIRTTRSGSLSNTSVTLDITVPAGTQLEIDTGAGDVQIDGVQGQITAHTGAGNVRAQNATGPVSLDAGAGNVDYAGDPQGSCSLSTGAGNITLRLPAGVAARVDLSTGIGNINLGGFNVQGSTGGRSVQGTIGSGAQASLTAHTGVGNVDLVRQ
jgi:DUF4097 and DUF4098 domain-containing protein YvlB